MMMYRPFRVAAFLLIFSAVSTHAAGDDQRLARGEVALDLFKKTCFPEISQISQLRDQAKKAGWQAASKDADPMFQLAADRLLKARNVTLGGEPFVIKTVDNSLYSQVVNDVQYFAIVNHKTASLGDLNVCHVYDFGLKSPANEAGFKVSYDSIIFAYAFNARYLSNFFWFYADANSQKPSYSSAGFDRPKPDIGLTGLHLSVGGLVQ